MKRLVLSSPCCELACTVYTVKFIFILKHLCKILVSLEYTFVNLNRNLSRSNNIYVIKNYQLRGWHDSTLALHVATRFNPWLPVWSPKQFLRDGSVTPEHGQVWPQNNKTKQSLANVKREVGSRECFLYIVGEQLLGMIRCTLLEIDLRLRCQQLICLNMAQVTKVN